MTHSSMAAIGELVSPIATWTPERDCPDGQFTYIDLSSVDQEAKIVTGARSLLCAAAPSRARQLLACGDVLVSTVRPNLNGVARVPPELQGATASTGFCVLRPRPERLDGRYLFHWVRSPRFVANMVKEATGASYPAISDRIVYESTLPVPPLSEQRRIAEVLDRADALRSKRRGALAQLEDLRLRLFAQMFAGHEDDPVVDLSPTRSRLPDGWQWQPLTAVARMATGHTPDRQRADYWNGPIPWISLTDIRRLDASTATQTSETVSALGIAHSSSVRLPRGTVCVSRTASVGFVTMMGTEMATSQDFVNWVCGPTLEPTYLMWAFVSARQRLRALSSGSTHKTIYMRVFELLHVLVPPVTLQQEFAQQIAVADELRAAYLVSVAHLDDLFASLQSRAFVGQL